jgi:general secretion pathway protein I
MAGRRRGFTLLEVLVATMLMGVAVAGLLGALRASLGNAARLEDNERALALARSQMEALLAARELPKGTPIEGLFPREAAGGVEAGWRARVMPFEGMKPPQGGAPPGGTWILDRIELEVWWRQGGTRRSLKISAYKRGLMRPEDAPLWEAAQQGAEEGQRP